MMDALLKLLGLPWEKGEKPFFTNPEGYEWYHDKDITDWAVREDSFGTSLPNIVGVFIRKNDFATRAIMDKETNQLLYDSDKLEDVAVHIDILKLNKRFKP